MAGKLIVVNAGAHGGIWTDEHGTRAVPLLPGIVRHLQAVRDLIAAHEDLHSDTMTGQDLAVLVTRVANLAVDRVESAFGELEPNDSLIYQDDRGGFICGATGAAPRSFRWPQAVPPVSAHRRSLASRGLAPDAVSLARRAIEAGMDFRDVLEDPEGVAAQLGRPISERSATILRLLAPSRLRGIRNETDRAVVSFMFDVISDGRFVETWTTEPAKVAGALGISLEPRVVDRILELGAAMAQIRPLPQDPHRGADGDDSPPPGDDSPPPGDDSPPPGDDSPPPGDDSPPPGDDSPPPGDDSPPPGDDSPPPGDDTGQPNISDFVQATIITTIIILIVTDDRQLEEELSVEEQAKF